MRYLGILLFILTTSFGLAQSELEGLVLDPDGVPCIGAIVRIQNEAAVVNSQGSFSISNLQEGQFELSVDYGIYDWQETIVLEKGKNFRNIEMQRSLKYEAIVVKGTRVSENMPFAHENVDKEELEEQSYGQDVPFILRWTPSMVVTSDAGTGIGYTGMRIRGSDPTRINVTVNGIPMNDAESQGVFWVNTPDLMASASDVQIQRGVGTSTNGAGAFGASVHINLDQFSEEPQASVALGAGSFGTLRTNLQFQSGLLSDHWYVEGRISRIQSDGYVDRASADLESNYLNLRYLFKNGAIRAYYFGGHERTYQAWNGLPVQYIDDPDLRTFNTAGTEKSGSPYEDEVDDYGQDHFQLHWDQQWGAYHHTFSLHYTRGAGFFEQYKANQSMLDYGLNPIALGGESIDETDLIRRRWLDNDFYGFVYAANLSLQRFGQLQFGGAMHRYDGRHFGEVIWAEFAGEGAEKDLLYYDNDAIKDDFNAYLKWNLPIFNRGLLYTDLQIRNITYSFRGVTDLGQFLPQSDQLTFFNPKVGFNYDWSDDQHSYLSVAVGHREPNRDDYTESPEGQRPNAEQLIDLEAGHEWNWGSGGLRANAYYMHYNDQLVLTGLINDVGASVRTNVDRSYRAGIELVLGQRLTKSLEWNANATFSRDRILNHSAFIDNWDTGGQEEVFFDQTPIAFSPSFVGMTGLKYNLPLSRKHALELEWLHKYVGRQFLDNTGSQGRSLDPYYFSDFHIRWQSKLKGVGDLQFQLVVNNLWDHLFTTNGWTYRYRTESFDPTESDPYSVSAKEEGQYHMIGLYPQAGRNFMFNIQLKF